MGGAEILEGGESAAGLRDRGVAVGIAEHGRENEAGATGFERHLEPAERREGPLKVELRRGVAGRGERVPGHAGPGR